MIFTSQNFSGRKYKNVIIQCSRLKGFVLTFKNPKLVSNLTEVRFDSPFIHIDVDIEFYLFRPLVGSYVKGFNHSLLFSSGTYCCTCCLNKIIILFKIYRHSEQERTGLHCCFGA